MNDVDCPYCSAGLEINHDDGYGYSEGQKYQQTCGLCGHTFVYTTSISFHYEAEDAPCLNGQTHRMKPVTNSGSCWPDWKECEWCGKEERGQYVEREETKP